ncbi:cysteine-rich CWC family protein [Evansella tamaricis]|uniref:Cysteine-rich CWC family protein n=1 Tax=Evansella tamaricis TaxID=2069301 RepID=A0ABS6JJC0_9BACI|nr:cysteine-rich CWC family protein [Evansella tamaricis]
MDHSSDEKKCPLCGEFNNCSVNSSNCWCREVQFPNEIFDELPITLAKKTCICRDCLKKYKERYI